MGKHIPSLKIGQVNDTPQSAGAILDVISTSQGSLPIPRMTNAQMLVLGNLVQGLLVDQTDSVSGYPSGVYRYSGSAWVGFGSANDIAYETWSTNANYTTINTTAKRLIVLQTGTLTATRVLTLSNVTGPGQEVLIVAGGSVTSTNKILVACGNKINVTLNSFDIVGNYSQTLLTSVATNSWSTGQATPQFIETANALTSPKIVRGVSVGIGNTRTWTTAGMGAGTAYGDIILTSAGILATGAGGETSAVQMITPYDPSYGWTNYQTANTFLNYWGYGIIQAGTKPLEYTTNSVNAFYWGCTYSLEHYSSDGSNAQPFRAIIYIDDTGVPSILETLQSDGVTFYSVSAGKLLLSATSNRGYTTVKKIATRSITQLPERYQKYSADGQTRYFTGTGGLGVGHTSQSTSAILQADSTDKGFLPPRMTLAQRSAITSVPIGLIVYQTDGTEGLYVYRNSGWTLLASAANNIRQVDVQLFNYALQQDVSYADAGTITTFINLNNQLSSATYQKFTYSTGTWSGGSVTNITFTAGVSTVSIAMAQYDFIRVVGVLAGANTQATLSIKTIIS